MSDTTTTTTNDKRKKRRAKRGVYRKDNIRAPNLPNAKLAQLAPGVSLGQVARACRISVCHASRAFGGKRQFGIQTAARVAVYLGVTIDELYKVLSS